MRFPRVLPCVVTVVAIVAIAACGSTSPASVGGSPQASDPAGVATTGGDIPDNVVWLSYSGNGFKVQYPEGWVRSATTDGVTFTDKDSRIAVTVAAGSTPTAASATADARAIAGAIVTTAAREISLPSGKAVVLTYSIDGSPDPVTGKRPHLTVDRYETASGGKVAILELSAQVGVDNKDAYLFVAQSFRWA